MHDTYINTVPMFIKQLGGLRVCLDKAAAFAAEKKIDAAVILHDRLAPDMFPLMRQIQIATDNAKGAVARLTGVENPKYEDIEATIPELQARIDKTISFLQSVPESSFEKSDGVQVTLPYFPGKYMVGIEYVRQYVVPNFLFHVVTAYGIMRHNGVPLGKGDYLNGLPLKDL